MGIFDKESSISREKLKSTFKKDSGIIPRTGGKKYYQGQRQKIVREAFPAKYGSVISKGECRRTVRDLKLSRSRAKTPVEKLRINREINYIKRVGGKRI